MRKILITGANSYIGTSFNNYLKDKSDDYLIDIVDMIDGSWKGKDFSYYDVIFHVAGIAHDLGGNKNDELYYKVNRDLAVETAKKAKREGVSQFIFMSSMLIYNGCKERTITKDTNPKVKGCYSNSKLQADLALQEMNDGDFNVAIMRPPMIFGPGCKGNFPRLVGLAKKLPVFPNYKNERSMLFIDNLCEAVKIVIDNKAQGIFFPQNKEYFSTTGIIKKIAANTGKKIRFIRLFNWLITILKPCSKTINKMFGDLKYDKEASEYFADAVFIDNAESLSRSI